MAQAQCKWCTLGTLQSLAEKQWSYQGVVTQDKFAMFGVYDSMDLTEDEILSSWVRYHILAMIEELGELLKTDKGWKTHRKESKTKENKIEEVADVFIEALNILLFAGVRAEEIYDIISKRIDENYNNFQESIREKEKDAEAK